MDISLCFFKVDTVKLLNFWKRSKCSNWKHLSLSSCKHTAAVCSRKQVNFCRKRSDFIKASAINTSALNKPCANDFLLHFVKNFADLLIYVRELFLKRRNNFVCNFTDSFITNIFVVCIKSILQLLKSHILDCVIKIVVNIMWFICELLFADFSLNTAYKIAKFDNVLVIKFDTFKHNAFFNFVSTGLNHNNLLLCTCNSYKHFALFSLFNSWVDNVFAVNKTKPNTADRTVPRNVWNRNSDWSTDHSGNFRWVVLFNWKYCCDNRYVISQIWREKWSDRSVDNTACKNSLFRRLTLTLDVSARNFTYGIKLFFVINA